MSANRTDLPKSAHKPDGKDNSSALAECKGRSSEGDAAQVPESRNSGGDFTEEEAVKMGFPKTGNK
jgi:hypothetical protein